MINLRLMITTGSDPLSVEKIVVMVWMLIVIEFFQCNNVSGSVLFYDSYYSTNDARNMLRDHGMYYIVVCEELNFRNPTDQLWRLGGSVSGAGETASITVAMGIYVQRIGSFSMLVSI